MQTSSQSVRSLHVRGGLVLDLFAAGLRHLSTVFAGLALIPLLGGFLGARGLGLWALLGTTSFLVGLSDLGTSTTLQRAMLRSEREGRELLGVVTATILVVAPFVALLGYYLLRSLLHGEAAGAVWLVLLAGVINAFSFPWRGVLLVRGGVTRLASARAAAAMSQVMLTALGLWLAPSLMMPAMALLLSSVLEAVLLATGVQRALPGVSLRPSLPKSRRKLFQLLRESAPSLSLNIAVIAAVRIDVGLLAAVSTLEAVAAYGISARAVDQSFVLAKQASSALTPRLGDKRERAAAVRLGVRLLGGIVASGMLSLYLLGQPILRAWAGDVTTLEAGRAALLLLSIAAIFAALHEIPNAALTLSSKNPWDGALPLMIGCAVNVGVSLWGASRFGAWAIAGGTVAGNLVTSVLTWRRASTLLRWSSREVLHTMMPALAAIIATLLATFLLSLVTAQSLTGSIVACVLATLCGTVTALLWRRA